MADAITLAVVGHPNEGKSSVVSTLAEDDQVPVSAVPGETRRCHLYKVVVDGEELLRLVDTPGFDQPRRTLRWFQDHAVQSGNPAKAFLEAHAGRPEFGMECELLRPIAEGAGILYVVDASRPIRPEDEAEIEILRLTGRPRIALINAKEEGSAYRDAWASVFSRSFNSTWEFNAHRATFAERIALLEALRHIHQDWGAPLARVIGSLEEDWRERMERCADAILDGVEEMVRLRVARRLGGEGRRREDLEKNLQEDYQRKLEAVERRCHERIRGEFKHNLFNPEPDARLEHGLMAATTWKLLGLTLPQFRRAMVVAGAAGGAAADLAASGITFGVFTAAGATSGFVLARYAFSPLAAMKVSISRLKLALGRREMAIGPATNPQLVAVFIDRALIYARQAANWAHARRAATCPGTYEGKVGVVAGWNDEAQKTLRGYHKALWRSNAEAAVRHRRELQALLVEELQGK